VEDHVHLMPPQRLDAWVTLVFMKKPALITLLVLAVVVFLYVIRAKKAAEAEAELWSEALDPVF